MRIDYQRLYEQLSEDWRNRDRITWQVTFVQLLGFGLLFGVIYGNNIFGSGIEDEGVKCWLLIIGYVFAWFLTFTLAQNMYLQAVGEDLINKIAKGRCLDKEIEKADRIPKPLKDWSLWKDFFCEGYIKKCLGFFSSTFLLLYLCAFIAGLFLYLINDSQWGWFIGGSLIALASAFLRWLYSYYCQKKY